MRGVDYGLGIGYNPETNSTPSQAATSRSAAVNSPRTGMMGQFKSNFVSVSSNSQSSSANAKKRPALTGFVSGGSIGGDVNRTRTPISIPGFVSGGSISGDANRTVTTSSLPGFVSGGSISGDTNRTVTTSSLPGFVSGGSVGGYADRTQPSSQKNQNTGGNPGQSKERFYFPVQLASPFFFFGFLTLI